MLVNTPPCLCIRSGYVLVAGSAWPFAGQCLFRAGAFFARQPSLRRDQLPSAEQVEELVFSRRSVRNFKNKPVPRELLHRILDGARFAPTAKNTQELRWIVLETREQTEKLAAWSLTGCAPCRKLTLPPPRMYMPKASCGHGKLGMTSSPALLRRLP